MLITTSMILLGGYSIAQEKELNQFDFWIGDWEIDQQIIDESGNWNNYRAKTSVKYILGGKMIQENWKGTVKFYWEGMEESKEMNGYSLRYYDVSKEKWVIYWMDETQPQISNPFIGSFVSDIVALFYRDLPSNNLSSRIKFHIKSTEQVDWQLDISGDKKSWQPIWRMKIIKD
jgi:hypothetical protein